MYKPTIYKGKITRLQLIVNMIVSAFYFVWWLIPTHVGNIYLYSLLFFGEIYHLLTAYMFWYTLWPSKKQTISLSEKHEFVNRLTVDIFITVAGEPGSVVRETVQAIKRISYPSKNIYILNDGYVTKASNWSEIESIAFQEQVNCITRKIPGGAKAGNINHALRQTTGDIIAVFDADMQPYEDFLSSVMPYFHHKKIAFVQTPQYYKNHEENNITSGAWEQQEFFFGPIMRGKEKLNAAFICGTNFAIRRTALEQAGGMREDNIAEDFLTSLTVHQHGWISVYYPRILASGLAPEDLLSYYRQQHRWARGSLEVLFGHNPLFKRGLSIKQKIQYLFSALFYFNGFIILLDMIMPLIFLWTGIMPVAASTSSFALFFIPFMAVNLYTIYCASGGLLTFRAISFTQGSFALQLQALFAVLFRKRTSFSVTSKQAIHGNFFPLIIPHILYVSLAIIAITWGIAQQGITSAVVTNIAWLLCNCILLFPFIDSALSTVSAPYTSQKPEAEPVSESAFH